MIAVAMSDWVRELRADGEVVGALAQGGVALLPEHMAPSEVGQLLQQAERRLGVPRDVAGREVVLVDDCASSPVAAVVAVASLRELGARRIVLAGPRALLTQLRELVDDIILRQPASLETPTASEMFPRI
jgi:hypothetical protein